MTLNTFGDDSENRKRIPGKTALKEALEQYRKDSKANAETGSVLSTASVFDAVGDIVRFLGGKDLNESDNANLLIFISRYLLGKHGLLSGKHGFFRCEIVKDSFLQINTDPKGDLSFELNNGASDAVKGKFKELDL